MLSAPALAYAQGTVRVGSFTKSTNTSVPVSQDVPHGLGETPKALILWTNGKTNESMSPNHLFGWGVTDGTTDKSMAQASAGLGNRSRSFANKALTIVVGGETTLAEADLSSWDATNFTLSWTTNNATAYVVHFIAIGGSGVSAKVKEWTIPPTTGNKAVTGVGFEPDVVIHAFQGPGSNVAAPAADTGTGFCLGVMDVNLNEWAVVARTAPTGNPSKAARGQQTDACLTWTNVNATTVPAEASIVSMDADGFTTNFSAAPGNEGYVVSLALDGINSAVGSFSKSTSTSTPVSQALTGLGIAPDAVLLTSFQDTTQASPVDHDRFCLGASDGGTEGSSAFQDADNENPDIVDGIDKTSKVFVKVNNSSQTIDAEADMSSLDGDGFTLSWTTNDAVATEILYLALAVPSGNAAPSAPTSLGGSSYVDGSAGIDTTPTLSFTQDDTDTGDTLSYRIQIDDSSDFSSAVVDYTSASLAQGATSFTVGQAEGSGSYTTGSAGQTLVRSKYYWRVRSNDGTVDGAWATANGGAVGFYIGLPTAGLCPP